MEAHARPLETPAPLPEVPAAERLMAVLGEDHTLPAGQVFLEHQESRSTHPMGGTFVP